MMLDDSSSMHGLRWINLKNSFTIFLNKLASDVRLRENTKITCIQYSSTAIEKFRYEVPNSSLIDRIFFRGEGTNFDPPLKMAYEICEATDSKTG